jgi:hypothetical protein
MIVRGIPETHPTDEATESWQENEWEKELMHRRISPSVVICSSVHNSVIWRMLDIFRDKIAVTHRTQKCKYQGLTPA